MKLQLNGHAVDYVERGAGPCLVLVPGSYSTTAAWRPVSEILADRFRIVATSLMGCGGTEEVRTPDHCSVEQQAEAVEAVIDRAGGAVHLVGHSWGGSVVLSVALRGKARLASLVLIEANPCDVLRQSGDQETYDAVRRMSDAYIQAYRSGESDAARRVVDFWEGAGSFDRMPQRVREYAMQTTAGNILDWQAHWAFQAPLSAYRELAVPTLVMHGGKTHEAMRRVARILATEIPRARLVEVAGARHFLITTHPREVAALIAGHVTAVETQRVGE
jgi:pimeloyl-ACP methyl ester carboxylesterase